MCCVIWVVIIPETLQKELRSEILNGNCYQGLFSKAKIQQPCSCWRLPSCSNKHSAGCGSAVTSWNHNSFSTPVECPQCQQASNQTVPTHILGVHHAAQGLPPPICFQYHALPAAPLTAEMPFLSGIVLGVSGILRPSGLWGHPPHVVAFFLSRNFVALLNKWEETNKECLPRACLQFEKRTFLPSFLKSGQK